MFKKFTIVLSTCLCLLAVARAQQPCATDEKYRELVKKYPQLAEYEQQFEQQMDKVVKSGTYRTTSISTSDTTIFDIPFVIHIVHDYGSEYLSDDDIYNAFSYYADVYMLRNTDTPDVINPFKQYVGNPRIRLHLATIDPNGKPTKGVTRFRSYLTGNADDGAKFDQWPPNQYVNIWFIYQFGASATGAAAYAYLPGMAAFEPYYDGVIGLASYLSVDKAIPHEIGHVLNLQHPWGNTNNPGVACGDDHVDDTPPTMGHLPSGCTAAALYDTTCATGYAVHYTSITGADSLVDYPDTTNAQNIMDYTYCQRMFTKGQVYRMRTALTSGIASRDNLYAPANLAATGALAPMPDLPPVADFSIERATGSAVTTDNRTYFMTFNSPSVFTFENRSWNDTLSGTQWSFSNGASTPASSSMTVVTNRFSTPGWVTTTVVAQSNAGTDTFVNPNSVYVADTTSIPAWGYVQNFTSAADLANWPMINFYNNQYKWEFFTGAGWGGNSSCIRYRSRDTTNKIVGTPLGDHDDFYTPAFNMSGISGNFYLNFYTTAAKVAGSGVGDSLEIDVSTNGGLKWTKLVGYTRGSLSNIGVHSPEYIPSATSAWVGRSVNIPAAYRSGNTFIRFRYWPGDIGNDFYMSDFYLYPYPTEVAEFQKSADIFSMQPNPSTNGFNLVFKTGETGNVEYYIKDITGRLIFENHKSYTPLTIVQEAIPRAVTPFAGMYLITMVVDGVAKTDKLVVY